MNIPPRYETLYFGQIRIAYCTVIFAKALLLSLFDSVTTVWQVAELEVLDVLAETEII